jgi:TolB-like protein/Flp pilus assembly protein TadD
MPGFIEEFKRRNVFRVAMAYLVITWLVLQVADTAAPLLRLPEWVSSFVFFVLALLFIPTLIFAWAFELTPEGLKRQAEVDQEESITGETGKKLDYITIAALMLVLVIVASDRFLFPELSTAPVTQEVVASDTTDVSIAVLPFADMSPNKDQEYFSDGISEEILNGLAKLQTMKVAGRTSAFAFKGRNEDLREIGAALGVQHVLEGSVRKDGDNLRITAQLIQVSDGFHLWSETYDRKLEDVFAVQDEISAAIVRELQGNLLGDSLASTNSESIDVATFEKYLLARELIHGRTNEGLTEARAMLEEITASAPEFAPGISSLAETLVLLRDRPFFGYGNLESAVVKELAVPLLERALTIDPELADAYAVRGLMQYDDREFEAAEANLLRAVELNPSLSKAWVWISNVKGAQNDSVERLEYLKKATAIDPLWFVPNSNLIYTEHELGRIDEVWQILERLRPFHQDTAGFHNLDGFVQSSSGKLAGAYRAFARAYELSPDTPSIASRHGFNLVTLQNFDAAMQVMPPQFRVVQNYLTGEWDEALPQMRQMIDQNPDVLFLMYGYSIGANFIGDYEGVADLYDQHIKSPEWVHERFAQDLMLNLIPAMQALGRTEDATLLLDEYRSYLESEDDRGVDTADHWNKWATYLALAGDLAASMDKLELAMDSGHRVDSWKYLAEYQPIHRDTRFIALQERNLLAINAEREELGWEPVADVGVFYVAGEDE